MYYYDNFFFLVGNIVYRGSMDHGKHPRRWSIKEGSMFVLSRRDRKLHYTCDVSVRDNSRNYTMLTYMCKNVK